MLMQHTPRLATLSAPGYRFIDAAGTFRRLGTTDTAIYARDVEIYGEGEPSEYYYIVVSGAVRIYKVLADGRRQMCAFHLRGDFFGLEADESHAFSAEAIVNSKVVVIKRSTLLAQAERDKEIARELLGDEADELKRVQAHVLHVDQDCERARC